MTKLSAPQIKKGDANQPFMPVGPSQSKAGNEIGLSEEFSEILDKIAQHLAQGRQDVEPIDIFAVEQLAERIQAKPVAPQAAAPEKAGEAVEGEDDEVNAPPVQIETATDSDRRSEEGVSDAVLDDVVEESVEFFRDDMQAELPASASADGVNEDDATAISLPEEAAAGGAASVLEPGSDTSLDGMKALPVAAGYEGSAQAAQELNAEAPTEQSAVVEAPVALPAAEFAGKRVEAASGQSSSVAASQAPATPSSVDRGVEAVPAAVEAAASGVDAAAAVREQAVLSNSVERTSAAEKAVPFTTFLLQGQGGAAAPVTRDAVAQAILKPSLDVGSVGRAHEASAGARHGLGGGTTGFGTDAGMMRGMQAQAKSDAPVRQMKALTRSTALRTLEKVERALEEVARSKDGKTISLHLDPVNLGKVKVDVSFRDGNLHARLSAESAEVQQLLREHAYELQSILRKLGLNVDSVAVSVSSDNGMFDVNSNSSGGSDSADGSGSDERWGSEDVESGAAPADVAARSTKVVDDHWVA